MSSKLTALAMRITNDRARCEAMGFTLTDCKVKWENDALVMQGTFNCVCGKPEHFNFTIAIDEAALDPARLLREYGAFSRDHLLVDGFTEDEMNDIIAKGVAYDLEHP